MPLGHCRERKTYDSWQEGLLKIFEAVMENKPFIMNVYHSVSREQIENYLFKLTYDLLIGVVEEKSVGIEISEEEKKFIADLYKYSFVGVMLDWIKQGMKENYQEIAEKNLYYTKRKYYKNPFRILQTDRWIFYQTRGHDKFLSLPPFCKLNSG